jgi:para-aminobenzoate synthetase component 1
MTGIRVTIAPLALPHGPRETMAKLRGRGRYALLESASNVPRLGEWSYIAGPARATLYTDAVCTRLVRAGGEVGRWDDPWAALHAIASFGDAPRIDGEAPAGFNFHGGWIGALGYDLARTGTSRASCDPALPAQWWMAVDQVLAHHHPSRRWFHVTAQGPALRWPWTDGTCARAWSRTLALARGPLPPRGRWRAGPRRSRTVRAEFERSVEHVRAAIAAGDVLQVNLTRREETPFDGDAWTLYEDLVEAQPAPFAAYVDGDGFAIASCSPERFLRLCGGEIEARPIKGTVARGATPVEDAQRRRWLATSEKNRAENLMIVDLMRNDLGRVARTGSVTVPELFTLEPHPNVWQMVSSVRGTLRHDRDAASLLRACWPPGSMTGAPKSQAMRIIDALEPVRRGFYAGSIGYIDCAGGMDLSVVIRTAVVARGRVMVQVGGGIVADSEPGSEWLETVAKGERLLRVVDAAAPISAAGSRTARRRRC